ncbi:MAG: hypothetical protein ACI9SP_000880 [Arenicella sp.]|jgi:hypothetical protein
MACQFNNSKGSQEIKDISSNIKLSDDLMFNEVLSRKFWNCPFTFIKKPLTQWHLSESEIRKIVDAMIPSRCTPLICSDASGDYRLPAGLTYIGQIVTHDIISDSEKGGREALSGLNLDSIFPKIDVHENLTKWPINNIVDQDGRFILVEYSKTRTETFFDFPREHCPHSMSDTAMVPDDRNDQNILVSQLVIMLMRLHNQFINELIKSDSNLIKQKEKNFSIARTAVTLLFQRIVIEEYLATLTVPHIYEHYSRASKPLFSSKKQEFEVPLEFSHSVFRFGHTMIRQSYRLKKGMVDLGELFNKRKKLAIDHRVDWCLFFPPIPQDLSIRPLHDHSPKLKPPNFNDASALGVNIAGDLRRVSVIKKLRYLNFSPAFPAIKLRDYMFGIDMIKRSKRVENFKNIVFEDLKSSRKVPIAGDIIEALNFENCFGKSSHSWLKISNFPKINSYRSKTNFKEHNKPAWKKIFVKRKTLFGWGGEETFSLDNAPLWLFILREAEAYPEESEENYKLGHLGSLVISEIIHGAIGAAKKNIWNVDVETEFMGAKKLYVELCEKPSMYTLISKVISLENNNGRKRLV